MFIKDNALVLFQGDSITDCRRDRNNYNGTTGYNKMVENYFNTFYAHKNITVLNRGISGNTTAHLKDRWEEDCIKINPDYLFVLIGINDTWRRYDNNQIMTVEEFESNYRYILNETKNKTNAQIMLIEPFLIHADANKDIFREDLNFKIDIVRKLAREFRTEYLALDGVFAELQASISPKLLADDGVHPTTLGYTYIAKEIIKKLTF